MGPYQCTHSAGRSIEERQHRQDFNILHEDHLPSDVCPGMQNPPTRYEILPWNNEHDETLPYIPEDLLQEVNILNNVQGVHTDRI